MCFVAVAARQHKPVYLRQMAVSFTILPRFVNQLALTSVGLFVMVKGGYC